METPDLVQTTVKAVSADQQTLSIDLSPPPEPQVGLDDRNIFVYLVLCAAWVEITKLQFPKNRV